MSRLSTAAFRWYVLDAAVSLLAAMPARRLPAQVIRIQVRDAVTEAPLTNTLLDVLGENGRIVQSAMTSRDGSGFIRLPGAGTYRVLVRRIGFQPHTIGPLRVTLQDTLPVHVRVPRIPRRFLSRHSVRTTSLRWATCDTIRAAHSS